VSGPGGTRILLVDDRVRALRPAIGIIAWAVLEELLLDADDRDGNELPILASARSLAVAVGIGKDAAARGLRRLTEAGLVRREDHRDPGRGRFARSVYVLERRRLEAAGIRVGDSTPSSSGRRHRGPRAACRPQSSLFDDQAGPC
jgi:DNA-binding transcriptional ArsR family regulator